MSAAFAEFAVYEGASDLEFSCGSSDISKTCSEDETGNKENLNRNLCESENKQDALLDKEASKQTCGYAEVDTQVFSGFARCPAIMDALDARGVADELLEVWTSRELQAMASVPKGADALLKLPLHVRHTSICVLSRMAQHAWLPQKCLAEAALLLDVYILKSVAANQNPDSIVLIINALPATCAALVSILWKNECVRSSSAGTSCNVASACLFAQQLQRMGYAEVNTEVTIDMINTQEAEVFQALRWRIQMPNAESWTSTFTSRLNVLTKDHMTPTLTYVWQHGMYAARMVMMHQASSEALSPKQLAVGLFAIGLVGARLLPLEAARPHHMTDEEWIHIYHATRPREPQPKCILPVSCSERFSKLLMMALGVDMTEIQEFACLAAVAMKDALEAQERDRPPIGVAGPVASAAHPASM